MGFKHNTNSLPKTTKVIYCDKDGKDIRKFPYKGVTVYIEDDGETLIIKEKG